MALAPWRQRGMAQHGLAAALVVSDVSAEVLCGRLPSLHSLRVLAGFLLHLSLAFFFYNFVLWHSFCHSAV
jgi:hypothetical protein